MKKEIFRSLVVVSFLFFISCSSDDDVTPNGNSGNEEEINNPDQGIDQFIWQGLNATYLYKEDVNDLANDRFATNQELFKFLSDFDSPESTFNGLLSQRTININGENLKVDPPFSFIVDDYIALENAFSGVSKSNGMDFGLIRVPGTNDVLGYVRLVLPGTSAELEGLNRGMYFNAVDGTKLTTTTDFNAAFRPDSYSIDIVTYNGSTITETDQTISLTKVEYTENPIFISKTLDYKGQKIGYILYNSFVFNFDEELNNAFAQFKADGITDLVLDLRYNGGGRVSSAIILSSLITGQFTGDIFSKETWNTDLQTNFETNDPARLVNRFTNETLGGTALNTLGLSKVHILATNRSASASELVINGLKPYIDVIQIGGTTSGKYQASITLYDNPNGFRRDGANPNHTYAIQPLVLKSANKDGVTDFAAGLFADVPFFEINNVISGLDIGVIGEPEEPFLNTALEFIINGTVITASTGKNSFNSNEINWEPKAMLPNYQKMYIDNIPFSTFEEKE